MLLVTMRLKNIDTSERYLELYEELYSREGIYKISSDCV